MKSNCTIWLEGPSDRVYLNHWLKSKKPELVEGLHYSINFYGGILVNYLTRPDNFESTEEIDELIKILSLDSRSVIIMNSGKSKSDDRLNGQIERLQSEFDTESRLSWITEGRHLENYIGHDKLKATIASLVQGANFVFLETEKFSNLLEYKDQDGDEKTASKVAVSRKYVANNQADLTIYDLEDKLQQLVVHIEARSLSENE